MCVCVVGAVTGAGSMTIGHAFRIEAARACAAVRQRPAGRAASATLGAADSEARSRVLLSVLGRTLMPELPEDVTLMPEDVAALPFESTVTAHQNARCWWVDVLQAGTARQRNVLSSFRLDQPWTAHIGAVFWTDSRRLAGQAGRPRMTYHDWL